VRQRVEQNVAGRRQPERRVQFAQATPFLVALRKLCLELDLYGAASMAIACRARR
jgi:hypothetical protein